MTRRKTTTVTVSTTGWPGPAPLSTPRACTGCADVGIYRVESRTGLSHWCAEHLPEQYHHRIGGAA